MSGLGREGERAAHEERVDKARGEDAAVAVGLFGEHFPDAVFEEGRGEAYPLAPVGGGPAVGGSETGFPTGAAEAHDAEGEAVYAGLTVVGGLAGAAGAELHLHAACVGEGGGELAVEIKGEAADLGRDGLLGDGGETGGKGFGAVNLGVAVVVGERAPVVVDVFV